jgi:hypothetical protein
VILFYNWVRIHSYNSHGGNDRGQSRETSKQTTLHDGPSLYGQVTIDSEHREGHLRLVTATNAQSAESRLSDTEPTGQQFGPVEITWQLLRFLREIVENHEVTDIVSISFNQHPEGGYKLNEVESAPSPTNRRQKKVSPKKRGRELHLFGCLNKSHLFGQFRLIFVREHDFENARAQFVAEGCRDEDMSLIRIGPNLISVLIHLVIIHESDRITGWCVPMI